MCPRISKIFINTFFTVRVSAKQDIRQPPAVASFFAFILDLFSLRVSSFGNVGRV